MSMLNIPTTEDLEIQIDKYGTVHIEALVTEEHVVCITIRSEVIQVLSRISEERCKGATGGRLVISPRAES